LISDPCSQIDAVIRGRTTVSFDDLVRRGCEELAGSASGQHAHSSRTFDVQLQQREFNLQKRQAAVQTHQKEQLDEHRKKHGHFN